MHTHLSVSRIRSPASLKMRYLSAAGGALLALAVATGLGVEIGQLQVSPDDAAVAIGQQASASAIRPHERSATDAWLEEMYGQPAPAVESTAVVWQQPRQPIPSRQATSPTPSH